MGVCAAALLCACDKPPATAPEPRFLLWRATGATNHVYLLGSVHVLREGDHVASPAVEEAYAAATRLVMEIDFDDLDSAALGELMSRRATDAGGLVESLGADGYAQAAAQAAALGLDLEPLRPTEPWFAALGVTEMALARLGFAADHGVESEFTKRALADGKPIAGLETAEFQVDLLDGMPVSRQREMFLKSIDEAAHLPELIDELLRAWQRGDERALRGELEETFAPFPDLYRTLIVDRNERWMPQLVELLAAPHDTLVIVGALHLIGDHSVIGLLEAQGYRVQRL
jgi:uncharacterized protein YbaP (TraB family)